MKRVIILAVIVLIGIAAGVIYTLYPPEPVQVSATIGEDGELTLVTPDKSEPVVKAVKEMVDAEYAAGRNTFMGDDELDTMIRLFDKNLHKLFQDRIKRK